ncbi:MAG: hypothetical protein A3G59_02715 [Candidatus Taylorbacteria bacterium RIFCSPLOWO2_12_FULL_47_20]|uniref:Uncharacterized protein n=2 Tax=Candidatus Tayloriibacteriota TaxID=1817919 RepID=A0A1G2P9Y2_9BACT|nr:MAG: hypothetical protein A3H68_01165 [Candidatus Taylorbacteria bacterium RIFCSPLOWO2_02_FULL_46_40]OHA45146.1 MAG: hypothetical protein A3G59_02715 [Candidatus Taylorbacteria bacterium RIFCSPLOWO2_12_FULL_47_20]
MENKVSKVIRLLIGAFVLFQAAMSFYILIPLLLTYYRTESPFLIPWFSLVVGGILGAISGVGILLRRKWGDITYLFFSIYPLLLLVLTPVLGLKINSSLTAEDWLISVNLILSISLLVRGSIRRRTASLDVHH